jgi:hypothetical protein
VRDRADSHVDFMIGWVEFEGDYLSRMAAWEEQPWRVTPDGKYESLGGETLESIAPFWKP